MTSSARHVCQCVRVSCMQTRNKLCRVLSINSPKIRVPESMLSECHDLALMNDHTDCMCPRTITTHQQHPQRRLRRLPSRQTLVADALGELTGNIKKRSEMQLKNIRIAKDEATCMQKQTARLHCPALSESIHGRNNPDSTASAFFLSWRRAPVPPGSKLK